MVGRPWGRETKGGNTQPPQVQMEGPVRRSPNCANYVPGNSLACCRLHPSRNAGFSATAMCGHRPTAGGQAGLIRPHRVRGRSRRSDDSGSECLCARKHQRGGRHPLPAAWRCIVLSEAGRQPRCSVLKTHAVKSRITRRPGAPLSGGRASWRSMVIPCPLAISRAMARPSPVPWAVCPGTR